MSAQIDIIDHVKMLNKVVDAYEEKIKIKDSKIAELEAEIIRLRSSTPYYPINPCSPSETPIDRTPNITWTTDHTVPIKKELTIDGVTTGGRSNESEISKTASKLFEQIRLF